MVSQFCIVYLLKKHICLESCMEGIVQLAPKGLQI